MLSAKRCCIQKNDKFCVSGWRTNAAGNPFFEKAMEYQKQYNKHGIYIYNALQTNGYLIDDRWCAFFKKNHFLVGLSVDGTKEMR